MLPPRTRLRRELPLWSNTATARARSCSSRYTGASVMVSSLERRRTAAAHRGWRRELVVWLGACLVATNTAACGASRPASSPPSQSGGAARPQRQGWSEPMQTLHFHSVYGAFSQLWKGNYELSLAGEA